LLFQALRDHQGELIDYCSRIEYSKAAFDESYHHLRGDPDNLPDWKRGAWALYQVMASFSGWPDGHSFAVRVKGCNPAQTWARKVGQLGPYAERLQGATITNGDGIGVIKQYDKVDVLQYVDPPYVGAEHRYKVAKGFDHEALAKALHGLQHAKVILSHYHCEPYLTFYGDWRSERMASTQSCKGATIHSPTEAKPVVESLWFNW
jgi:DNA adenine methylase